MFCSRSQVANDRLKKVIVFALLTKKCLGTSDNFSLISETLRNYLFLAYQRNAQKLLISCLTTSKNISTQRRKQAQYEREESKLKGQLFDQPSQESLECDFEEIESYNQAYRIITSIHVIIINYEI